MVVAASLQRDRMGVEMQLCLGTRAPVKGKSQTSWAPWVWTEGVSVATMGQEQRAPCTFCVGSLPPLLIACPHVGTLCPAHASGPPCGWVPAHVVGRKGHQGRGARRTGKCLGLPEGGDLGNGGGMRAGDGGGNGGEVQEGREKGQRPPSLPGPLI